MLVPVLTKDQRPLMPTTKHRAMKLVAQKEATPFWKRGVWCIRLNKEPSGYTTQVVAVGVDPGSKKEGFSVVSEANTIANFQADAVTHVKDALKTRREMRRARRFRKTPCRQNKTNRAKPPFPPSTKARWDLKLRIIDWLAKIYPVTDVIVEDIQAKTRKGGRKWNVSFSPLEVGKRYFYDEISSRFALEIRQGWENSEFRKSLGLKKLKNKMSNDWHAHCVDGFALAKWFVGGDNEPTTKKVCLIKPFRFARRQLHKLQPAKGGKRAHYGSTYSCGFKRGSIVSHPKYGITFVGGWQFADKAETRKEMTLCSINDGSRLARNIRPEHVTFKSYAPWRLLYA